MKEGIKNTFIVPNNKFILDKNYLIDLVENLKPYSTRVEKEILLSDIKDEIKLLRLLGVSHKARNKQEAKFLIFMIRKISLSDVFEGITNCPKCKVANEFVFEIKDFDDIELDYRIPIGIFESAEDFVDIDFLDSLLLNKYNSLIDIIKHNNDKLMGVIEDFVVTCRVKTCQTNITVVFDTKTILSKTNISNIYREYFNMGFYLHYSNDNVDNLLPFERNLLFGMLKQKIEKDTTLQSGF